MACSHCMLAWRTRRRSTREAKRRSCTPLPSRTGVARTSTARTYSNRELRAPTLDTTAGSAGCCLCYPRSEEHKHELQSLMRHSYAVFSLKKNTTKLYHTQL